MLASLHGRILLTACVILVAFLGMTGLALDEAFRASAETALRDRLHGYLYTLMAGAEVDARGVLRGPPDLRDERFNQPGSGLYADIRLRERKPSWRSPSTVGVELPVTAVPPMGREAFNRVTLTDGTPVYVLSYHLLWEEGVKKPRQYTFRVAETLEDYYRQVQQFRHSLWGWLGGAALLLLVVQGLILRWGLAPLRRVAADLAAIEEGRERQLKGHYPEELQGLTDNLNALLASSENQLTRYRDALGDLAHSLKTPLAVLHGALRQPMSQDESHGLAQEQLERINKIIEYQLQRAAASGRTHLARPIQVLEKAREVKSALLKVYADKPIQCSLEIDMSVEFRGDEGDLLEVFGNLLDNAFKWCRGRIKIIARMHTEPDLTRSRLMVRVEDDGPGIPPSIAQNLNQRGKRADSSTPGHGLGLAIVQSIVLAYEGTLVIEKSALGGAAVTATL